MPGREEVNPYDAPGLREAYRQGWKARQKGKPAPMDLIAQAGEKGEACFAGYEDCGSQDVRE